MPELPEVETVRHGLETAIAGKTIENTVLRRENLRIPFPKDLPERLQGRKIKSVKRRAKYLLINLDNDDILIGHLGMSGNILIQPQPYKPKKHDHALIFLSGGTVMILNDPRRFGLLTIAKKNEFKNHKLFKNLGLEPLSEEFGMAALYKILQRKNTDVKTAIMDQREVVGVGNIYAAESLFMAGISPKRNSRNVTEKECGLLVQCIKKILKNAIKSGGSTISDYKNTGGFKGQFQNKFQVYGRQGKKCLKCKENLVKIVQGGRSSFYCKTCQN